MRYSKPLGNETPISIAVNDVVRGDDGMPCAPLVIGDVLDSASLLSSGYVMVRWRGADGTLHERSVCVVKGLTIERGDLVLLQRPNNWPEWVVTGVLERRPRDRSTPEIVPDQIGNVQLEAKVDGRRVEIEGRDEIVLRCGQASITLRRNGRVVIRGIYVETRSKGTNRIKGGVVLIN